MEYNKMEPQQCQLCKCTSFQENPWRRTMCLCMHKSDVHKRFVVENKEAGVAQNAPSSPPTQFTVVGKPSNTQIRNSSIPVRTEDEFDLYSTPADSSYSTPCIPASLRSTFSEQINTSSSSIPVVDTSYWSPEQTQTRSLDSQSFGSYEEPSYDESTPSNEVASDAPPSAYENDDELHYSQVVVDTPGESSTERKTSNYSDVVYFNRELEQEKEADNSADQTLSNDEEEKQWMRDWNAEWQEALKNSDYNRIANLAIDFVATAEKYGQIIISEKYLPANEKTIKPRDIGGVAGGEKYITNGILFKFAQDQSFEKNGRTAWLYGKTARNDGAAMKAAGHDLKGLISIRHSLSYIESKNLAKLYGPLMALIDYSDRGFRLVAVCLLPIDKDTIVYGSNDGGRNIHNNDERVNKTMLEIGKLLNLREHGAGKDCVKICGPGDLEIHFGKDNNYYALDFARLWPPEAPVEENNFSGEIYHKMMRAEFVTEYSVPLSSDAFAAWGKYDPDYKQYEADLIAATKHLYNTVIPNCAKVLDEELRSVDLPHSSMRISTIIHSHGVNLRHLGHLRTHTNTTTVRDMLLTEMIARLLKNMLQLKFRSTMETYVANSEAPFTACMLDFFNVVLGNSGIRSEQFWETDIKDYLLEKYKSGLTEEEAQRGSSFLLRSVNMYKLFFRTCYLCGITMSDNFDSMLKNGTKVLHSLDFVRVSIKVKHTNLVDEASAYSLYNDAKKIMVKNGTAALSLLDAAKQRCQDALRSATRNASLHHLLAIIDYLSYVIQPDERYPHRQYSKKSFMNALKLDPNNPQILFDYACSLSLTPLTVSCGEDLKQAGECFSKAISIDQKYLKITLNDAKQNLLGDKITWVRAMIELHTIFKLNPNNIQMLVMLGECCAMFLQIQLTPSWESISNYFNIEGNHFTTAEYLIQLGADCFTKATQLDENSLNMTLLRSFRNVSGAVAIANLALLASRSPTFEAKFAEYMQQITTLDSNEFDLMNRMNYGAFLLEYCTKLLTSVQTLDISVLHLSGSNSQKRDVECLKPIANCRNTLRHLTLRNRFNEPFDLSFLSKLHLDSLKLYDFRSFRAEDIDHIANMPLKVFELHSLHMPSAAYEKILRGRMSETLESLQVKSVMDLNKALYSNEQLSTIPLPKLSHFTGDLTSTTLKNMCAACPNLTHIVLRNINSPNEAMKSLAELTKLTSLELSCSNAFTDEGAEHLLNLKNLEYFHLTGGSLKRGIEYIAQLTSIKKLSLNQTNTFSEECCVAFSALVNLESLIIQTAKNIKGLKCFANCKKMKELVYMNSAPTTLEDFEIVVSWTKLESLQLQSQKINGALEMLGNCWLKALDLSKMPNCVNDDTLRKAMKVGRWKNLERLSVSLCGVTEHSLRLLPQYCPKLRTLDMSGTNAKQMDLCKLHKLKYLELVVPPAPLTVAAVMQLRSTVPRLHVVRNCYYVECPLPLVELTRWNPALYGLYNNKEIQLQARCVLMMAARDPNTGNPYHPESPFLKLARTTLEHILYFLFL